MRSHRVLVLIGCLTVVTGGLLVTQGFAQKESSGQTLPHAPDPTAIFMRQKLDYSQRIIEGIALENYDLITINAMRMWSMARKNAFKVTKNVLYREKVRTFQTDVTGLLEASRSKNTTNVLKAYTKVTADCVDCHQSFRHEQVAPNIAKSKGN